MHEETIRQAVATNGEWGAAIAIRGLADAMSFVETEWNLHRVCKPLEGKSCLSECATI
jgi:hypothetical protein